MRTAYEEVITQSENVFRVVTPFRLQACQFNKSDITEFNFLANRFHRKIFNTSQGDRYLNQ